MSFSIPFTPTVPVETYVKGNPYPQLRLQTAKFDPTRGFVYDYQWDGANQTLMLPVAQDCINAGMMVTCTFENDRAVLRVTDSTSEYTIDSWEIIAAEVSQDLFNHPAIVGSFYQDLGDTTDLANAFNAVRGSLDDGDDVNTMLDDPALADLGSESTGLLIDFYNRYKQGSTAYYDVQYAVKHKTNVSNRWSVNIADIGIYEVYTPSQFFAEVTNPYSWVYPMPGRMQYKLAAIPSQPFGGLPTPPNNLWGWLKFPSTETTDAHNRVAIETNYTLNLWDTNVYSPF